MNHKLCKATTGERVITKQDNSVFNVYNYAYCEHDELVWTEYLDSYIEGNIAGAYKEEWGKHG